MLNKSKVQHCKEQGCGKLIGTHGRPNKSGLCKFHWNKEYIKKWK